MTRPVVRRLLPTPWVALQIAELRLRHEADNLSDRCSCAECAVAVPDREHAAKMLEGCADELRALWQAHERDLANDEQLVVEVIEGLNFGDKPLDEMLPEAGIRICSPSMGLYLRFADSTSDEEPDLLLLTE